MNRFLFTCGDINGIGPEIVIKSLNKLTVKTRNKFYFVCPQNVFSKIIKKIPAEFDYGSQTEFSSPGDREPQSQVTIVNLPSFNQRIGFPTKKSGRASYLSLQRSFSLVKAKRADAILTAPVSKTAFKTAGINFPGQTELFAHWTGEKNFVMTFLSKKIKVALLTIHLPLSKVSKSLTSLKLTETIKAIYSMLKSDFGIQNPSIAVLGINPHAGEKGIIGNEETEIIEPTVKRLSKKIEIDGPFPSDAFFARKLYRDYDMTLGMYHDQVLIPFKHINAGRGVNFTAGLPIVRTSPDHGVAYDIAGDFIADESSMIEAYNYANRIVNNRKRRFGQTKRQTF